MVSEPNSHRVLIVDDDPDMAKAMAAGLSARGYAAAHRQSAEAAWELLQQEDFDAVVTDLNMEGMSGVELTELIVKNRHDLPVILITAFASLESAVATLRAGAYDFVTKPFDIERLGFAVDRAVHHRGLRTEVKRLRDEISRMTPSTELVGDSAAMRKVQETIARVAGSDAPVLVLGESGTGKELVARDVHLRSKRADRPFVAINCADLSESVLETELCGRLSGAFGGTLFLDDLDELPPSLQARLLRALEQPAAARLIAATKRDLASLVESGRFREDLYYRINVVRIELPPLRTRGNDVLLLAAHFIALHAPALGNEVKGFSLAVAEKLLGYAWPGNVRELQNCIQRAIVLARFDELTEEDLPPKIREYKPSFVVLSTEDPNDLVSMEEVERRYIERVMEAVGQNKTQAAKILAFDRTTLYRKLERYQIGISPEPPASRAKH